MVFVADEVVLGKVLSVLLFPMLITFQPMLQFINTFVHSTINLFINLLSTLNSGTHSVTK